MDLEEMLRSALSSSRHRMHLQMPFSGVSIESNVMEQLEREFRRRLVPYVQIQASAKSGGDHVWSLAALHANTRELSRSWRDSDHVSARVLQPHEFIERYNRTGRSWESGDHVITQVGNSGTLYVIDTVTHAAYVLFGDVAEGVKDARRLVRDIFAGEMFEHGYAAFHASAAAVEHAGILIAGHKGAGKSTTLFDFMCLGADLVSNDRVFIRPSGTELLAFGTPEHLLTKPGTLAQYPQLTRFLPDELQRTGGDIWLLPDSRKLSLQYQDVAAAFGTGMQAAVKIHVVILPEYRPHQVPTLEPTSREYARDQLRHMFWEPVFERAALWHNLTNFAAAEVESAHMLALEAVANAPAFRFSRSSDSRANRAALSRFLSAL